MATIVLALSGKYVVQVIRAMYMVSLVEDGYICPEQGEGSATWLLDVAVQQEHII